MVAVIVERFFIDRINEDSLTEFQYDFFDTTSGMDVVAVAMFSIYSSAVVMMMPRENGGSPLKLLKLLFMHPAHVAVGGAECITLKEHILSRAALSVFCCMRSPIIVWTTFQPVWDSRFTGDELSRIALSAISLVLVLLFLYKFHNLESLFGLMAFGSTQFMLGFSLFSLMYAMEKALELYIFAIKSEKYRLWGCWSQDSSRLPFFFSVYGLL